MDDIKVLIVDGLDCGNLVQQQLNAQHCKVEVIRLGEADWVALIENATPDVVLVMVYRPNAALLLSMAEVDKRCAVPIVMFAEDQRTETIDQVIQAGVSAYIVDGFEPKRIKTIIDIAVARFKAQQALKNELTKTKNQLEERKLIDRAKAILIKSKGCSEDQAYHAIRKLAMDGKISVGEVAKNVIAMAELFK